MEINKIYHGDCIELLKQVKSDSVDLILTDPPYNIAKDNNFDTMGRAGIDFGEWDKGFDLFSWIDEIPRLLKKDASVIIFNDWKNLGDIARHCEKNGMIVKNMFRWVKTNPMPRNRDRLYITDFEVAIWCVAGANSKWTFNRLDRNYERPELKFGLKDDGRIHPTQKPVKLMEHLLKIHSNPKDLIIDPFAGSGSTAVACLRLDRNFITFEKDEKYYNIAKERIDKKVEIPIQMEFQFK